MTIAQTFEGFNGLSPEEGSPVDQSLLDDEQLKDDVAFEDVKPGKKSSSSNSRKGPHAADKRANHNAIERARRESLNGRFLTLAEALPSMAKVKRPSKSVIVNKALDFVFEAQIKERALIQENNELRCQLDQLRRQCGMPPLPPPAPLTGSPTESSMAADALAMSMGNLATTSITSPGITTVANLQQLSPTSSFPSPPSATASYENSTSPSLAYPGMANLFCPSADSPPSSDEASRAAAVAAAAAAAAAANVSQQVPPSFHQGLNNSAANQSAPFLPHHFLASSAQAAAIMQAQASAAQFGYLNPSALMHSAGMSNPSHPFAAVSSAQHHQAMFFAQPFHQNHQQQSGGSNNNAPTPIDMYGSLLSNSNGGPASWSTPGASPFVGGPAPGTSVGSNASEVFGQYL